MIHLLDIIFHFISDYSILFESKFVIAMNDLREPVADEIRIIEDLLYKSSIIYDIIIYVISEFFFYLGISCENSRTQVHSIGYSKE